MSQTVENGERCGLVPAGPTRQAAAAAGPAWPSEATRLIAATRRALSVPKLRVALLLRLSGLAAPLPRPHHRRIAATILEECARQHQGETFELPSGDMLLLCHLPSAAAGPLHPETLPEVLARLFSVDVPPAGALTTLWHLERDAAAFLAYTGALEA